LIAAAVFLVSCGGGHATNGKGGSGGGLGIGGAVGGAVGVQGSAGAAVDASGAGGGIGGSADAWSVDASDAGFAADFAARARTGLASAAPSWTCATALPSVAVADAAAARDAVRQFIAQVVGVPATDILVSAQTCGATMSTTCATTFAHDTGKSGGSIYFTAMPLADELEANATDVEVTLWTPMQNGMTLPGDPVMSGISDGLLVGMVVFNAPYACQ
jgi:hypothetical protein